MDNTPRFKNIGGANLELKERDGTVVQVIKPGETVVGQEYLEFVGNNMGPFKWLNKPVVDDRKIVFDTSLSGVNKHVDEGLKVVIDTARRGGR